MIECRNITKIYKSGETETKALWDVSFKIEDGEFIAIIGPSGSGKSTLMHILGALDTPTSGEYLLDGYDVSNFSDNELAVIRMKKIGFVFQAFNLLPRASVLQNIYPPLIYEKVPREKRYIMAEDALIGAGLDKEKYHHLSNQLSGGQMQRVAIARALVNNPALILADEPTGNLDSKTGEIILRTFRKLNKEGRTVILITHEKYIAEHADRVISIKDGQIENDSKSTNFKKISHVRE